ncbi:MAG: NAD(P)-dependent alcohol dehydrogenase [Phycisphaeraceae bacterium JB051]
MKAITHTRFGSPDVLHLVDIPTPEPTADQVRVKIHASTVTSGDVKMRGFENIPWTMALLARPMFGFFKPRQPILGVSYAGEIDAVGQDVDSFTVGQRVFGITGMNMGTNAQFICVPAGSSISNMPENLPLNEAAAIPFGSLTAMHFLKAGKIKQGDYVLIYGASGAVGVAAIQIAKNLGATVTGVCSTKNLQRVQSLGADHVIDYTQTDFTQSSQAYDIVFDTVGKTTFGKTKRVLAANGRYLLTAFAIRHLFQMGLVNLLSKRRMVCSVSADSRDDLQQIKAMIEAGTYRAVIDRCYPLEDTAEAHRYVDGGHKVGSVVLTVAHGPGD